MIGRRSFLTITAGAGAASMTGIERASAGQDRPDREYYELRAYELETGAQKAGLLAFWGEAAIPAYNRIAVNPLGVFVVPEALSPVYVLLPHASLESVATATDKLLKDDEFLTKGAAFLDAPADNPAYKRIGSRLLEAFTGMPKLERPAESPTRVFQLRTYESPSMKTGKKKIEMFNTAEIAIFRKVGLNPVFFGESLIGTKLPNLTYMLGFENADAQKTAWDAFRADPDWLELSAKPE
ncbi:MAG: NIPSNAP family protein, partial [Candidatus Hydrogenedentes bacterium]|nr:NIPSNAP family protein [Candidatus Hydrogenedentota bacterium]